LYADKNSEDSPNTSIATLSRFSSIFNRAEDISEDAEDDSKKLSFFATKFGNSDVDIENFSSSTSETVTSESSLPLATAAALTLASGLFWYSSQENLGDVSTILATGSSLVGSVNEVLADPGAALERVVELTDSMGNLGIAYFGVAYCIAEILAVPAIPLTASAGYLFGPLKGTAIVLLSASIAAGVSFQIGRTLLRDYVENLLKDYPKFATIDKAIGREGFKLMLLLRLSPIFPFALSNYLYGASSINFPAFFGGTVLGFAPGTLAYVYTGYVGKALTADTGSDVYPWYVYLGGLTLFAGLLKVVADTATRVVEEIEAEESQGNVDM
jgi:uncharacterized membrane protein YdjX (TVP38/TMEM64 family)